MHRDVIFLLPSLPRSVSPGTRVSSPVRVMKAERPLSRQEIDHVPSLTIIEGAVESQLAGGLEALEGMGYDDLSVMVEKVSGELRVHIRHDDEGDRHGLFVHGFRPGSRAESSLKVGTGNLPLPVGPCWEIAKIKKCKLCQLSQIRS